MQKLSLNLDELSVETFDTLAKDAWVEVAAGVLTVIETCSCVDCRTATAGRCCPP
jgi:hypothetical protein